MAGVEHWGPTTPLRVLGTQLMKSGLPLGWGDVSANGRPVQLERALHGVEP